MAASAGMRWRLGLGGGRGGEEASTGCPATLQSALWSYSRPSSSQSNYQPRASVTLKHQHHGERDEANRGPVPVCTGPVPGTTTGGLGGWETPLPPHIRYVWISNLWSSLSPCPVWSLTANRCLKFLPPGRFIPNTPFWTAPTFKITFMII